MSAAATPSIRKDPGYLRIATEEAYAPAEMLRMYRKLLDEKGTDDPGFLSQWGYFLGQADRMKVLAERFHNLDEGRIRDMDATGIARQIVSLTSPGVQIFDAPTGTALATSFNDQLAEACRKHPTRFSGLAAIAPQNPAAAAKELERGVTKLGLKGAIINSNTHGEYLDDPKFYDILGMAESLDVPIYLHPATAPRRMIGPMIEKGLEGAFYGFAVETSVHLLRMIMSGVFDRFPKLQVIAGHGGEGKLALAAVAEQEEPGDTRCLLRPAEAADEIERQILPGRRAARGDQPPGAAAVAENAFRPECHRRIAIAEKVRHDPVRRGLRPVEQAAEVVEDGAVQLPGRGRSADVLRG